MLERIKHKQKVDETRDIYTKLDANDVPEGKNEIRLFVIARNESLRLPYFLKYYSEMGVDRFFLIDNNSTDNTVEIACAQKNVHVFQIKKSFKEFWYWIEYFLEQYGKNRWCIVVDVDELLFFPFKEKLSFKGFINYLEEKKYTAFRAFLLDMYSDKAINDTVYFPGDDPLKTCPFFDTEYTQQIIHFFDKKKWENFKWPLIYGGVRQRLFGKINNGNWVFCLTKAPLFKYSDEVYLTGGMHAINGVTVADVEGVVFHTKFMHDFVDEVKEEMIREEHYENGIEYKIYNTHLADKSKFHFKNDDSVRFEGSDQLIRLNLIKAPIGYKNYIKTAK